MQRRLERSTTNRVVSGVCGGVAEYLAIDPTLVRAFFVIASIVTAFAFVLVYVVLLILMPLPGQRPPIDGFWPGAHTDSAAPPATGDPGESGALPPAYPANGVDVERRNRTVGYILVAIGLVFLLGNFGAFRLVQWSFIWPVALIGLGVLLLMQRTTRP